MEINLSFLIDAIESVLRFLISFLGNFFTKINTLDSLIKLAFTIAAFGIIVKLVKTVSSTIFKLSIIIVIVFLFYNYFIL